MRTLSAMPAELSNLEFGLELELNSDDVAAAEAAVAADGELFTCSCCSLELSDKESLHLHQISQHSISQLSIALLLLRGFDVSPELEAKETQDLCCGDSESESTVSAHSSFMCGFSDEFNKAVHEVCAMGDPNITNTGTYEDTQLAPLSNAPQYSTNCAGSYCFGVNDSSLGAGSDCVDMNSNLSKVEHGEGDLIESIAHSSLLTNSGDKVSCNERQTDFVREFCEQAKAAKIQPEPGKNSTLVPSNKDDQTTIGRICEVVSLKKRKLSCAKSTSKGYGKQSNNEYERREFPCEICGRKYKRKSHLGRHIRMHSGVRPFACTLCDKRFAVRSILKQHMRVHTGERPFKCHFCSQRFPQKSGLVTHMMLHTGKPYKCDQCNKSFVSNHKLSVHKRSHEEQSGRWPMLGPYSCPTCSTRFFTNSALLEHANVHITGPAVAPVPPIAKPVAPSIAKPVAPSIAKPVARDIAAVADFLLDESASSPRETPDDNGNTHNLQEVTAGQALLTLMDSNAPTEDDSGLVEAGFSLKEDHALSDDCESDAGTASDDGIDFEFCDVPLDLKPSIYLKEECFELNTVLDKPDEDNAADKNE